jgi:CoA:oxalate CoA-transferase
MPGPLAGVRVLDFTHALAGPFGTMALADLGAEVIKVERPQLTEATRGLGPFVNGRSTYRFSLDRGKRGIQLDLKHPQGRDLALRLAERSDVLTENFTPGTMDGLGLGYEAVRARNPRIVYASCSGFGQTGPYASRSAVDIIAQAMSGLMSLTGEPGRGPMRVGASIGDTLGGAYLAMGVITALYERERSGQGQRLDISMVESVIYHLENAIVRYSATGEVPEQVGPRHPLITPFQPFQTADGWMVVASVRDWQAFCVAIGEEDLGSDPRFQDNVSRTQRHAELEPLLAKAFLRRATATWMSLLDGLCITAPVYTIQDMINDPHVRERGVIATLPVPGPEPRTVMVPSSPVRLGRTPPQVKEPAPALGEHTDDVLRRVLGLTEHEIATLHEQGVVKGKTVPGAKHPPPS